MKSHPNEKALMNIIEGMKRLRIEKVKGYKNREDEDPSIEIEEAEEDELEDLVD